MLHIEILSIRPEFVCNFIQKAKEFHAKEEITFAEDYPNSEYEYDWAAILADHADDLTYQDVSNNIAGLDHQQKVELLALMYLGRGDYDESQWQDAVMEAKDSLMSQLVDYLLAHPYVADYMESALELFDFSCEE